MGRGGVRNRDRLFKSYLVSRVKEKGVSGGGESGLKK